MFRRRPILSLLSLLAVAGLLSAAVFLARFDLNRYREELQSRLSDALSQPVRLGTAQLSLRPGPAFDFSSVEIGDPQQPLLKAERLSLQAELLPLLIGKLSFAKVVLHRPDLHLSLSPTADERPETARPALLLHQLLSTVRVHSLQIAEGTVQLTDQRFADGPQQWQLKHIALRARHIYSPRRGRLHFSAQFDDDPNSTLQAAGHLYLPTDAKRWRDLQVELSINLQQFALDRLCRYYPGCGGSSGRLDLQLTLDGSPAAGLRFASAVQGNELRLQLPPHYYQPLPLTRASLSGLWTATPGLDKLDDLVLQLDDLQLAGHASLQQGAADPWLEGGLSTPALSLPAITRLLPAEYRPFSLLLQANPSGGTLRLAYSRFAGPLSQFRRQSLHQIVQEATLYLQDGQFRFGDGPLFSGVSATATWQQQRLTLSDGSAQIFDSPLQFSATVEKPFQPEASINLGAGWVLPGRNLAELLGDRYRQTLSAAGPIPLSLNLNGPAVKLQWALKADLQASELGYLEHFHKPSGMPASIRLAGALSVDEATLDDGQLQLGPVQLAANGRYQRQGTHAFFLQLALAETELERCQTLMPALEPLQLQGRLAGRYRLQGAGRSLQNGRGSLQLEALGVNFPSVLGGELKNFSGRIALDNTGAQWQPLSGQLGRSPLTIAGRIDSWTQPRTELRIAASQLRANELIFPSPQARLHQLKGQLVVADRQVEFRDVQVTLDGGSRVTVNGKFQGGEQPAVLLRATAERADIDQVVALWQGPTQQHRTDKGQRTKVVVEAEVGQGTYQRLDFQQATATVTSSDGLLRISPLRFATGGGHGLAQIAIARKEEGNRQLTVSGHVEGVEAAALKYGRLIGEKGLLQGALDGDFHLTGELGGEFLPTSYGAFQLAIRDGVLHKFSFLAKVFSLLNVSQILTLKLPDMVNEGMPFSLLQGSFTLHHGLLSTEDLAVTSNAMNLSLVGDMDLVKEEVDLILGVKPLRTVDKLITRIPIAGWLLTGEEKALITAHFEIKGPSDAPRVQPIPVTSISGKVLGIFQRVFGLPGKLITDPGEVLTGQPSKPAPQAP